MGWPMSCCKTHSIHRTASPDVWVLFPLFCNEFSGPGKKGEIGCTGTGILKLQKRYAHRYMQYTNAPSLYVIIADTFKSMFSIASTTCIPGSIKMLRPEWNGSLVSYQKNYWCCTYRCPDVLNCRAWGLVVDGDDRIMHMDPVSVPVRWDEWNLALRNLRLVLWM